ncbi:MAG: YdeI/OmpD-associated family protein [Sphingobacterium sp.]
MEFEKYQGSKDYFLSLSKSTKKMILNWGVLVKKQETRQKVLTKLYNAQIKSLNLNIYDRKDTSGYCIFRSISTPWLFWFIRDKVFKSYSNGR